MYALTCLHTHASAQARIPLLARTRTHTRTQTGACTHKRTHTHMHAHTHTRTHECVHSFTKCGMPRIIILPTCYRMLYIVHSIRTMNFARLDTQVIRIAWIRYKDHTVNTKQTLIHWSALSDKVRCGPLNDVHAIVNSTMISKRRAVYMT